MPLTNKMSKAMLARMLGGHSLPSMHGIEKSGTQSWKAGALLIDDDAGSITESSSPVASGGNRTLGMADNDAAGVTAADVMFQLLTKDAVIELNLSDSTAGTHTLVQGDQYAMYPLTKDTASGAWYLDANAEGLGALVIAFKDAVGTVDARVYAIIQSGAVGNSADGIL